MAEEGYSRSFAAGLVCTGAALSIVIPPSVGLLIYGVIAETSISDLFMAAVIPGLFVGVLLLFTLSLGGRRDPAAPDGSPRLVRPRPLERRALPYALRVLRCFGAAFGGLMSQENILAGSLWWDFTQPYL